MYLNLREILSLLVFWKRWVLWYYRDGVLKMTKGSMVIMKGVRRNNLYYLKGTIVTGQVETSISSDDDCTQVWQMRPRRGGEKSLQASAKRGSLKGVATSNLKLSEHGVLDKKKVKFSTRFTTQKVFLIVFT